MTARPTIIPIISPTSTVPSAIPSLTGIVAVFEITSVVTSSLTYDEVAGIESDIISGFAVSESDVSTIGTKNHICV